MVSLVFIFKSVDCSYNVAESVFPHTRSRLQHQTKQVRVNIRPILIIQILSDVLQDLTHGFIPSVRIFHSQHTTHESVKHTTCHLFIRHRMRTLHHVTHKRASLVLITRTQTPRNHFRVEQRRDVTSVITHSCKVDALSKHALCFINLGITDDVEDVSE